MPPHCDTRDGPVVKAAIKALETGNLNYVLIWIPRESEKELRAIFEKTLRARNAGKDAKDVAEDWFFENTIRLHRAEGTSYTGMKPAGLVKVRLCQGQRRPSKREIQRIQSVLF